MKKQLWCLNLFASCVSESTVPHRKIKDMFQYSFKMSKILFQHVLLLLSLQSWHLHCARFPSPYNIYFVPIPMQVCKGHRHNFYSYTQIYVCFLTISLYSLSPALMNSSCTFNSLECNGLWVWQEWEARVYTMCEPITTADSSYALEITMQHPYWLPDIEVGMCCISLFRDCFFIDVRFSFYWKNFLFKLISCSMFDSS